MREALDTGFQQEASQYLSQLNYITFEQPALGYWVPTQSVLLGAGRTSASSVSSAVQAACSSAEVQCTMLLNLRMRLCSACTACDKRCLVAASWSTCCSNLQHSQGQAQPFTW